MNVACEKCSAKYAVPDSKVKGRKVRITCKRCGAPIVVDGRAVADRKSAEKPAAAKPAVAKAEPKPAVKVEPAKPKVEAARPAASGESSPRPAAVAPKVIRPETPPTAIASAVTKPPTGKSTMLGGLGAPTGVPGGPPKPLAGGLGPKPAQRTMLGGVTAPRPATPIASKAAVKQTLMGGLLPAYGAAPSPRDDAPLAPEGEREWTVAVTDEDHYEMNTDEVVQAFTQGNIDEDTFIWKEGMDDWLTPFEVPSIAAALRKAGQRPKGENPMAFDDATRVGPSPMDKKPAADPTPKPGETQGVWKEPGDWKPMAAPGMDLAFDDVTVAMAAPQSRQLLEESRDLIAAKQLQDEEEELTIQGESPLLEQIRAEARLKEGLKTVPPPAPAAGTPYAPPPVEPKIPVVEPKIPSAAPLPRSPVPSPIAAPRPFGSPVPSPVASPIPSPASPAAPATPAAEFGSGLAAPADSSVPASVSPDSGSPDSGNPDSAMPVSVEVDSVDDLLGAAPAKPGDGDESKTGERNETSVLFSLDAIGPNAGGQPKPKPAKMKSTLLGMAPPPPPRPAHLSAPGIDVDISPGISASSPDLGHASSPDLGGAPMDLGGPTAAGGSLSSPELTAPAAQAELTAPLDGPDPMLAPPMSGPVSEMSVPKKSGGGIWVALLLLLLLLGGGAAYAYTQGLGPFAKPVSTATPSDTSNLAPAGQPTSEPTQTADPTETAAPSASADEAPSDSSEPTGTPQERAGKLEKKPDEKLEPKADEKADEKTDEKAAAEKTDEKADEKTDEKADEKAEAAGPPFDEVAARNALASAAGSAGSCKKPDGPTGQGRAIVTFAPSGRVTSAVITGAFAGTTVGGCIARVFRGATVPAFSGGPKTVSKTFSVE